MSSMELCNGGVTTAVRGLDLKKRVSYHTPRHSFATHLLELRHHIRIVPELLGHANVSTALLYPHVSEQGTIGLRSPLDALCPPPPPFNSPSAN